jgi:hypothetical protein
LWCNTKAENLISKENAHFKEVIQRAMFASKTSTISNKKNTPERITQKMTHEVEIWTLKLASQCKSHPVSEVETKQAAN